MAAETLLDHPDVVAQALDRVLVTAWLAAPSVDVIARLEEAVKPLHERIQGGVALVVVPSREPPDPASRKALQTFLERQADRLVGATALLAVTGIKGALLRTAAKGAIAAMRMPFPIRTSGSPREAAKDVVSLLTERGLPAPPEGDVERFIEATSRSR